MDTTLPEHTDRTWQDDADKALKYCQDQIKWYRLHADRARIWCHTMEIGAIVLGGAVPVTLLIDGLDPVIPAGLSATAAMLVAVNTTLRWRSNWSRYAHTAGALEAEKVQFEMRAGSRYGAKAKPEEALDHFVSRVTEIILNETTEWRTLAVQPVDHGGNKGPHDSR